MMNIRCIRPMLDTNHALFEVNGSVISYTYYEQSFYEPFDCDFDLVSGNISDDDFEKATEMIMNGEYYMDEETSEMVRMYNEYYEKLMQH